MKGEKKLLEKGILLDPVLRNKVKFNPGLSQILSKVFLSKNMSLELTTNCCVFASRLSDDNTECYSKQCTGGEIQKWNRIYNPGLALYLSC